MAEEVKEKLLEAEEVRQRIGKLRSSVDEPPYCPFRDATATKKTRTKATATMISFHENRLCR